jgi:hypothetical protein
LAIDNHIQVLETIKSQNYKPFVPMFKKALAEWKTEKKKVKDIMDKK